MHVVSSKISLGEGDENSLATVFCLILEVNNFVRTQYKCLSKIDLLKPVSL